MFPGRPLDERYALLAVVITSSQDGAVPSRCSCSCIEPNIIMTLQSQRTQSAQSQSNDSVRYQLFIEYEGAVQVR